MKNWKTTTLGVLLAVLIAIEPIFTLREFTLANIVLAGLIVALSYFAKDAEDGTL